MVGTSSLVGRGSQGEAELGRGGPDVRLSLVTTVFNRWWQLRETLPHNLASIRHRRDVDLVLVDFGGSDSEAIAAYIDRELSFDLLDGHLKYFRAIEPWTSFEAAPAKNACHRLATGEFLLSVDADNFITRGDLDLALEYFGVHPDGIFHQTVGPAQIAHRSWERYHLFAAPSDYHDEEIVWDGSFGRIGVARRRFDVVNGYNENFIEIGMEDVDFVIRCIRTGASYRHFEITRPAESVYIDNGTAAKEHEHSGNVVNRLLMDESLARNELVPSYVSRSSSALFQRYVPQCERDSASARVTLFSSAFGAERFVRRFCRDVKDVLDSAESAVLWVFDVIGSHPPEVSAELRHLAERDGVHYVVVRRDPGLYPLWNIALKSVRSEYVGNLNVDDLRGRGWLSACLHVLDSGLADVASPVTVPFEDAGVASYDEGLAMARAQGSETRWFEYRAVPSEDPRSPAIERAALQDGVYDQRDMFQVLPDGQLETNCIPNASPIWRMALHHRIGWFDEGEGAFYPDLALWMAAGAAGMRFRQVDYPALFFLHASQDHRRRKGNGRQLWSLALRHGDERLKTWARRRTFDLSRVGGSYGVHHFKGWNWVRDQVSQYFVDYPGHVMLDLFVERTFFWNERLEERDFCYPWDWLGFVHTTPHRQGVATDGGHDLISLLEDPRFIESLPYCRGLVTLSEPTRAFISEYLQERGFSVSVFRLFHPTIPVDLSRADGLGDRERQRLQQRVFHVGWHSRAFSAFARLNLDPGRKVLLIPPGFSERAFVDGVVNAELRRSGLGTIDRYVRHIYTASAEEYENILRWGTIFNCYVEPAGSNLVSECLGAGSLLVINRHPALEEYLSPEYPLFYDSPEEADRLVEALLSSDVRAEMQSGRRTSSGALSIVRFLRELERIGEHCFATDDAVPRSPRLSRPTTVPASADRQVAKTAAPAETKPAAPPAVSVVVPVYNKVAYVGQCLESILGQSLHELEVICVDDCSTDGSMELLERVARIHPRVRIVRQERHRGAWAARNVGLEAARGEFVQFTDADDLLNRDALRKLVRKAKEDGVEVVRGGIAGFHPGTQARPYTLEIPVARSRFAPLDHRMFWVPWWCPAYLFSRRFLQAERIQYPELSNGEDPVFLAKVLSRVPYISTISDITYRYRQLPPEHKGRVGYRYLLDYLRHADAVRALFMESCPDAWRSGFAPFILPEIESMIADWPITVAERAAARAEMQRIFELGAVGDGASKRKLLFLHDVYGAGGLEPTLVNRVEALRSAGFDVRVMFQYLRHESEAFAAKRSGFTIKTEDDRYLDFIRRWAPDAVVVIDAPWLVDLVGAADVPCPVLFESHLIDPDKFDWRVRAALSDVRVSGIVAPSEPSRALLVSVGADPEDVRIVPDPVDAKRFGPDVNAEMVKGLRLPEERRLLLCATRSEPALGAMDFVPLCARARKEDPSIQGVVVGRSGDSSESWARIRAEADADGHVTVIEHLDYDDMPFLYTAVAASGGCMVSTSRDERGHMAVLEAMSCRCPVVVSDSSGLTDIVEDGKTGLVFSSADAEAAVAAIRRTMHDGLERGTMVSAAATFVHREHGLVNAARAYVSVFEACRSIAVDDGERPLVDPGQGGSDRVDGRGKGMSTARSLAGWSSAGDRASGRKQIEAGYEVVPGMRIGFEPSASVEVELQCTHENPVEPEGEVRTVALDYRGPSRWLTIEAELGWPELSEAGRYEITLTGRADRPLHCRVMLRVPRGDTFVDHRLCDLLLSPEQRSARGWGRFNRPRVKGADTSGSPKAIFFLDPAQDLHAELDQIEVRLG